LGVNANLQLVGKSPIKETDEVFGYVGHGSVDTVLRNAHPIDGTKLLKLNEMTDGEVAACLLNLVYPRAFSRESLHGIDVSCELRNNKDLFLEAAFAQQFIAK
uniref:BTB domain-containing protein n=1 Tax=Toxocara canis TaxID=6265 RepID=A0A183U741_TOXCA